MLKQFSIKTVREGIRWSKVEQEPYKYDWTELGFMMRVARQHGVQQVWDLCHFGFPDDLTPLHPMFTNRFVAMCSSFADFYYEHSDEPLIIIPINEVSFLSWLGGEVGATVPYCTEAGWKVKYALMRAYIKAVEVLKETYPEIIILSTEPLVNIVPPMDGSLEDTIEASIANENQFQVTDMLTGRICPELGGKPEYLDILGLNFYYSNQFEYNSEKVLPWANLPEDSRWLPLRTLLLNAWQRYDCPFLLAETSHPGEHRPNWITYVTEECTAVLQTGAPFWGMCLYPILDRPDWDDLSFWHHSGLWDIAAEDKQRTRTLNDEYAQALHQCMQSIAGTHKQSVLKLEMISELPV